MSKIDEAIDVLKSFGLPQQQHNKQSALILLALLNLTEEKKWSDSTNNPIRIHDIKEFVNKNYGKTYQENTRESLRKSTIHQFEQAALIIGNPDKPERQTNSPKFNYAISTEALMVLKSVGSSDFSVKISSFIRDHQTLVEKYDNRLNASRLSLKIDDEELSFSPGPHNKLQIEIVTKLKPTFFPDAELAYLGDTQHKMLKINETLLKELHFPITQHDKLPDVIYYDRKKNAVLMIEAVTSVGPMSPTRHMILEDLLSQTDSKKIYLSAFLTRKDLKKHLDEIAWETEVWIAEYPEHMVHFNGPKFLFVLEDEK